ncbi:MAG: translation initiation factor IF-3 [Desulfatiglandales bacterium]
MGKQVDEIRVNEKIMAEKVRLVSSTGQNLGIVGINEALRIAREEGLDLVEVAPNADPPVCKVMDYGKFKYRASKKIQESKKKTKVFQLKEVKLRPRTDDHDLETKIKSIRKFLEKKNRVKVTIFYRGRELAFFEAGEEMLNRVLEAIKDVANLEDQPKKEGTNRLSVVVIPR